MNHKKVFIRLSRYALCAMRHAMFFITLLLTCAALAACVSATPARYYTLTPVASSAAPPTEQTSPEGRLCLAISTVEIPDYMDRPYIMMRDRQNGMAYSVFDRWAGSLQEDVVRVLAENLSTNLKGVTVLTGRRAYPVDYWMKVSIRRFDPIRGDEVQLRAVWSVLAKDGKELLVREESMLTEPMKGQDYAAAVSAMSRALGALGDQMAVRLRPIVTR